MRRYLAYLWYVMKHKWYVFLGCCDIGIVWRGLTHDLSKLFPDEFVPYARHFYRADGTKRPKKRDETGYYKPTDTGDAAFDFAWLLHQKRNDHHWQWWVLAEDEGGLKVLAMSDGARREMLADWRGAGRAQGKPDVLGWYTENRGKMQLAEETRAWVEYVLSLGVA